VRERCLCLQDALDKVITTSGLGAMALVNRDRQSGRQRKKNLVLGAILNEADLPMHRLYPIQLTKHPANHSQMLHETVLAAAL